MKIVENVGYVYSRLIELAVEVNHLTGKRKFNYDEIQPKVRSLKATIEKFKTEFKDIPALLDELASFERILANEEQKKKEARAKKAGSEPGERE